MSRFIAFASLLLIASQCAAADKPRLIILTDIGGDPDDQQSMIRLMTYSNEFDIEGLIATAAGVPGELKQDVVKPQHIREIVEAYGKVRDNLLLHAPGYPTKEHLLERIKTGNPKRGMVNIGAGKDTEGSDWIIRVVDQKDSRPVNISIWGGSTELAQALWQVRNKRTAAELKTFLSKLRVYDISHQDDTGSWIVENFPDLFYVLSKAPDGKDKREGGYRGMYLGGEESLTSPKWVDEHVRLKHGPLGALYPTKTWTAPNPHSTLKEGDTPSWFFFLPTGLNDPAHPEWGGWGGRYKHIKGGLYRDDPDTVNGKTEARATVYRWRPAYQNDFQARMDWCVKPAKEANHPPLAVFHGNASREIIQLSKAPGANVVLDADGSTDPDGNKLSYRWWIYREAGTYVGDVKIENASSLKAALQMPRDSHGKTVHVIVEVSDDGAPPLTTYRRIVLTVAKK
jgi:Cellulose-binding Sde182, nucleoside hydrolase-like domain/Cellulose-binding protein Sde0182, C-terminal domain